MKTYDIVLALFAFGIAVASGLAIFFVPINFGRFGWAVAFPGWWLVGITILAISKR